MLNVLRSHFFRTLSSKKHFKHYSEEHKMAWNYDSQESWADIPNCHAGGRRQSPINIVTKEAVNLSTSLTFEGNYKSHSGIWTNTGNSLQFTPDFEADIPSIKWKEGQYFLKQFHFHWAINPGEGSEHLVNGQAQDSELHFVHKKHDGDQIAVLGIMLQSSKDDSQCSDVWKQLQAVPQYGESIQLHNVSVEDLLPVNKSFWHYEGSLTTPPCDETVQWFVFKEVLLIPQGIFQAWSKTPSATGTPILYNFRKTQPINGRQVFDINN